MSESDPSTPKDDRTAAPCPMKQSDVIERYFFEHRAKLLDLAAFLDRIDRAENGSNDLDFRIAAFRRGIEVLLSDAPGRARRVQEVFSDMSMTPVDVAPMKGALGACDPETMQPEE